ncbi:neuraminidase-like domain-containing protein [Pseudomonas coleopterorum]|uniref:neuraminidase-like domain-containing protein n=2 Tax=Pseudomonas TaxID=286 RepID=UPI0028B2376D|nr:neuraminidase-like domain-containing protein [Pseudomonas coleopterorum]
MTIAATLNESFRDALVAYYLGELVPNDTTLQELGLTEKLRTENDLYEYLLLDTQVTQAVETSPVASAIASLQQYINGALLGMEPGYDDVRFSEALLTEWRDQRNQYPLWAANQQLAWYPSLYIDPSLRMKKSAYFQQLENDINQNRISVDTTQEAVQAYLASFEEVANLTIINGYIAGTDFKESNYYFIGKSRAEGAYYWRSVNMSERSYLSGTAGPKQDNPQPGAWSDWKRANLPISEAAIEKTIRPVYFNNRLFVTWVELIDSVDPAGSGDLEAVPPKNGTYEFRELAKPKATSKLRLNLTYKKYDDSWSAPQCYMETEVDPVAITYQWTDEEKDNPEYGTHKIDLDTIAVVDVSTNPEALFLAMYAGYVKGSSTTDGRLDKYRLLKTLKIDKNFNSFDLFPEHGLVDGTEEENEEEDKRLNRNLVMRVGILFAAADTNAGRFQFPVTGVSIRIKPSSQTTCPHSGTSGLQGWNYAGWQPRILHTVDGDDIQWDEARREIKFTTRVNTRFAKESGIKITSTTGTERYEFEFYLPEDDGEIMATLLPNSRLTCTAGVFSSPYRGRVWLMLPGGLNGLISDENEQHVTFSPNGHHTDLAGKRVNRDLLRRVQARPSDLVSLNTFNLSSGGLHPTSYPVYSSGDLKFLQFLARPSSMSNPTPESNRLKVNLKVGSAQDTLLPNQDSQSATIKISPETLRPDWNVTWPDHEKKFTIIHGVYVMETNGTSSTGIGHAIKATEIELEFIGDDAHLIAPKISYYTNATLGTAEYIDFDRSTIARNDRDNGPRQPIRMNTLFARNLIERANIALENLLSWETQHLPEPALAESGNQPFMDFKGANGLYFWELFFHLPFLISHRLNTEQQFSDAEYWLSFIFDPTRRSDSSGRPDYWNVRPLVDEISRERSTRAPIDPDGIASDNPVHYRKAVYNHFIKNLIDRGDSAYRQLTPDALNEAKLWYVRVLDLLGPRPDKRLVSGWEPITLNALANSVNGRLRDFEQRLNEQARLTAESEAANEGQSLIMFAQPRLQLMPFTADPTVPELDSPYFRIALNRELVQN